MGGSQSTLNTLPPLTDDNTEQLFERFAQGEDGLKLMREMAKPKYGPLDRLPCANVQAAKYTACDHPGISSCSNCKLVAYCSKVSMLIFCIATRVMT